MRGLSLRFANMGHAPLLEFSSSAADLVYAMNENGRVVHVREVVSGLACGCRCPACGMPLIAKKGLELTHHFAHEAQSSCRAAAETALHRMAKEIVEQALKLWLPAVTARYGTETRELYKGQDVIFTRAQSEARHLHEVVPDLFLERGDHMLLVEICVTHPCDDAKRAELRAKGIATLEIDLSAVPRNASREEVAKAVLHSAQRQWIYHPKIEAEIGAIRAANEAERKREKEALEKMVAKAAAEYADGLKDLASRPAARPNRKTDILRAGFGKHIGIDVGGSGCFTVTPREWQFIILQDAFAPREDESHPAYTVRALFEWFKKRQLIRPSFRFVAPEVERGLIDYGIGFLSPYRSIEKYLDELRARGIARKTQTFYSVPALVSAVSELREADERHQRYRESLVERGEKILQALPESEREGLTGAIWLDVRQHTGMSLAEAINTDDPSLDTVFFNLRAVEDMLFSKGRITDVTLGLPIAAERERHRAARQAEADAREAARLKALRDAEEGRVQQLRRSATRNFQAEGELWLSTPKPELDNRLPLELAHASEHGLDRALTILDRDIRRRREEEKHEQIVINLRSQLESKVGIMLGDAARPFLASPYPELDRKKPLEYCVCAQTLQTCLELAEKVRRAWPLRAALRPGNRSD